LDAGFNNPLLQKRPNSKYECVRIDQIGTTYNGGTPSKSEPSYWEGSIPWVSPKDFSDLEISESEDHISERAIAETGLRLLKPGTVLVVYRSGVLLHSLPVAVAKAKLTINQDIKALLLSERVQPAYLVLYLHVFGQRLLPIITKHSTTVQSINSEQFNALLIPLPPLEVQCALVSEMERERESRRRKLAEADTLLSGLDAFLLDRLALTAPKEKVRSSFAVRLSQIDGPINPERYMAIALEKSIRGTCIEDVVSILEDKVCPSRKGPNEKWDWIRIDDLENLPLGVKTIRTEIGSDIEGTFFAVQENDILLARLGPTILNQKIVLCPKTNRHTVGSSEFLVLRCKEGWNPVTVLWTLRTSLYRDLIYSKGRGATPSRYRVSREDLGKLPFPQMSKRDQDFLAKEIDQRLDNTRRLREEAAREWEAAKARFEAKLLND
jgi:restriction endonuclease S subunit